MESISDKAKLVEIDKVKPNENNPRLIKDAKYEKLLQSIKEFPEMLQYRPLVVSPDMVVLGGNMRLAVLKELGWKEVPVIVAHEIPPDRYDEFIIKDNVAFGDWDWDVLANEWDQDQLVDWGIDLWTPSDDVDLDGMFDEDNEEEKPKDNFKIILEYTEEEGAIVKDKLLKVASTLEQAVWNLVNQ